MKSLFKIKVQGPKVSCAQYDHEFTTEEIYVVAQTSTDAIVKAREKFVEIYPDGSGFDVEYTKLEVIARTSRESKLNKLAIA